MQGDGTLRRREAGKGDALPLVLSVLKSCGAIAAELISPDIFFSCEVRECEAHVGMG